MTKKKPPTAKSKLPAADNVEVMLPKEKAEEVRRMAQERGPLNAQAVFYQGPIPPASEAAKYEAIHPGLADRIVAMAERDMENRHLCAIREKDLELEMVRANIRAEKRGMYFGVVSLGFSLVVAAGLTVTLVVLDAPLPTYSIPGLLIGVPVFMTIRKIIDGRNNSK